MATEVAVISGSSGVSTFYSTYAAARSAASSGDTIQIWANLTEQLILKNGVDIDIIPGRVLDVSSALATITDDNAAVECNITGAGIIKNTYNENYPTGPYYECIKILNGSSKVFIQCDYLESIGGVEPDTIDGSTIKVSAASKFHLTCNSIISQSNAAIDITNCGDINIQTQKIEGGGNGASAVLFNGSGLITSDELRSIGKGTCLHIKGGIINATISKITSLDTENADYPTILLDDGSESQNLILYFDEIQNLNTNGGDAVKITQGKASLIGRRISSVNGLCLSLSDIIISALIQSDEIISAGRCIQISNSDEQIVIDANYIEGNTAEDDGVIYSNSESNFLLRNAKIKNINTDISSSPGSIGIYLDNADINMELENIIIVSGDSSNDSRTIVSTEAIDVKNLGLFVNKPKSDSVTLQIGDDGNFKYIVSDDIT